MNKTANQTKDRRTGRSHRRISSLATCLMIGLLLVVAAITTNWFGLRNPLLRQAVDPVDGTIPDGTVLDSAEAFDESTREKFAAVLRNMLYNESWPDGKEYPADAKFAVADVDADGREELVVLCYPDVYAGFSGYIIGYDWDRGDIFIQLVEFPLFEFLENGNLKVLMSHNQTLGEMHPYSLYRYLSEKDSYERVGIVYAEDKRILEELGTAEFYPSQADTSGTGTVYFVSPDSWSETPIDESEYLAWLAENQGDDAVLEITYLELTEENIRNVFP